MRRLVIVFVGHCYILMFVYNKSIVEESLLLQDVFSTVVLCYSEFLSAYTVSIFTGKIFFLELVDFG